MFQDEVSHPLEGVRPPAEHWVDRPEVYSSNAQPTGTNRPRACLTNPQLNLQSASRPLQSLRSIEYLVDVGVIDSADVDRKSYGGHGERETPGPIPNPEVKPFSADGTATERLWESRTPPDILSKQGHPSRGVPVLHFQDFSPNLACHFVSTGRVETALCTGPRISVAGRRCRQGPCSVEVMCMSAQQKKEAVPEAAINEVRLLGRIS